MNQMQKRLEIIKLAISMTDEETVKLQLLKLEYFENDSELSEIIIALKQKYYAKAQGMITQYNSTSRSKSTNKQNVDTCDSSNNEKSESLNTKQMIEEFALLRPINKSSITQEINNIDTVKELTQKEEVVVSSTSSSTKDEEKEFVVNDDTNDDSNEEIEENATIVDNARGTLSTMETNDSSESNEQTSKVADNKQADIKDDICINTDNYSEYVANYQKQLATNPKEELPSCTTLETSYETSYETSQENTQAEQKDSNDNSTQQVNVLTYDKQPDISIIFHNKASHFLARPIMSVSKSAAAWMKHISNGGYTDNEIHKMLLHINKLKDKENYFEAAQLILVCGSTQSPLGQLILARELIKGDVFEKNEQKAFELISELASTGYDEAICDYGQLVEYGIGTEADTHYAEELYKEAVNMDSERGRRLYEAIRKKNHKFLSFLRG